MCMPNRLQQVRSYAYWVCTSHCLSRHLCIPHCSTAQASLLHFTHTFQGLDQNLTKTHAAAAILFRGQYTGRLSAHTTDMHVCCSYDLPHIDRVFDEQVPDCTCMISVIHFNSIQFKITSIVSSSPDLCSDPCMRVLCECCSCTGIPTDDG